MRELRFFVFVILFFLFFSKSIFAARSLTITSSKDSLFGEEEITITASPSGFTNGETIYIKGSFYQNGTSNYFGFTKNGDTWIKNGESIASQRQIKIGEWGGELIVKSDFSDSGYKGEGGYKLKLGFYYTTSGGNLSSVNWSSNILDININEPDPTPTPTPTSVPANTPTPTNKLTPTPTPTKTPTPTSKPTSSMSGIQDSATESSEEILGKNSVSAENEIVTPSPTPITKILSSQFSKTPFLLIIGGVLIFVICGILSYLKFKGKMPFFTAENDI